MTTAAAAQAELPEPNEYVLVHTGYVLPKEKYLKQYPKGDNQITPGKIEVREQGERSHRWITQPGKATITVYRPAGKLTASVVICPGGGYSGLSFDKEGTFVAEWFQKRGIAAGVLKYSLSKKSPISFPSDEAHLAIQLMKVRYGGKVGIMGFSAGGHLAAMTACHPIDEEIADGTTAEMSYDSPVDFLALIYPVITMAADMTHGGSRQRVLGDKPTPQSVTKYSAEEQVSKNVPPTFLVHASDDKVVPAENSIRFYQACLRAGVPAELHLYERGGHGFGMWKDRGTVSAWPAAFERWLASQALITVDEK